jgi:Protein of unknown function (DUF3054)
VIRIARRTERWAVVVDAVAVLVFVLIGRANHGEAESLHGVLRTLWPFAAGLAVGWVLIVRRTIPGASIRAGVIAALGTVVLGLVLRAGAGQGLAPSFVVVAVVVILLLVVGWRLAWRAFSTRYTIR